MTSNAGRARPAEDAPALGSAIGIARVLCILGIVYVHAWTGRDAEMLLALSRTTDGVVRWVLIELVGRSAVPLLGAISGWLAAPSVARRGWRNFVDTKARTVLAPMLAWNGIALALVSGAAWWGTLKAPLPNGAHDVVEWLFCLTESNPINVQIAFLRDLFLCLLAAPLLIRLSDRALLAIALFVAAWTVSGIDLYLLLRPQILLFFIGGLLGQRHGWAERIAAWPPALALAPYALLAAGKIALSILAARWLLDHVVAADTFDLPLRVAAAIAVWRLAVLIAAGRAGVALLRLERYAFLLFCAHLVFIWLLGPVIGAATGPLGSPAYLPYLVLQPLLALLATIMLARILAIASPRLANLLSGGRLARDLPGARGSAMERAPARSSA